MLSESDDDSSAESGLIKSPNSSKPKVVESRQTNASSSTTSPSTAVAIDSEPYVNGSVIYLMARSKQCEVDCTRCRRCCCSCTPCALCARVCPTKLSALSSLTLRFPLGEESALKEFRRECKTIGLQVPDASMKRIVKLVNNAPLLHMYHVFYRWYGLLFFVALCYILSTVLTVCLAGTMVLLYGSRDHEHTVSLMAAPVLVAGVLGCALGIMLVFYIRKKKSAQSNSLMGRMSQELNRRYKFLLYIDTYRKKSVALCLVKYDAEPCRAYLKELLVSRETSGGELSQQDDAKFDKRAGQMMFTSIPGYVQSLRNHSHLSSGARHFIAGQSMCLCQYVESLKLVEQLDDDSVGYGHKKPEPTCWSSCFQMSHGNYDSIPLLLDQDDPDDGPQHA